MSQLRIRPYQPEDLPLLKHLESQILPYTPDVTNEVEAMFERARLAELAQEGNWMELPSLPERSIAEEYEAYWVAEQEGNAGLLGIVGVQAFRAEEIIPNTHPLDKVWRERGGVAELRTLRVAPDTRRLGVGTQLCRTVIAWAISAGYNTLILNTTAPQYPALNLYRKLGFQEVGISYIGRYELVWLELDLTASVQACGSGSRFS